MFRDHAHDEWTSYSPKQLCSKIGCEKAPVPPEAGKSGSATIDMQSANGFVGTSGGQSLIWTRAK